MKVATYSGVIYNNKIWFSNIMANGLYAISMIDNNLEYIAKFETADLYAQYQHKKVIKYNDKLIFIPLFSDVINIYDLVNHTQTEIIIKKNTSEETISDAIIVDDELVLFPLRIDDPLIKVNLLNNSVEYDNEFTEEFSDYIDGNDICIARCQLVDECVEFALFGTPYFVIYNLKTKEITIENVDIDNLYMSFRRKNKSVVFITNDTSQVNVLYEDGRVKDYIINSNAGGKRVFNGIVEYHDKTYIFPAFSNQLLSIKEEQNYDSISIDFIEEEIINPLMPKFYGYILTEDYIGLLPFQSKYLYLINDDTVSSIHIEEEYAIEKMHIDDVRMFDENDSFGLDIYLKALINS